MKMLEYNDSSNDINALKEQVLMQQTQWKNVESGLLQHIQLLEEKLRLVNLKRFGKSSEKDSGQRELFDEVFAPGVGAGSAGLSRDELLGLFPLRGPSAKKPAA